MKKMTALILALSVVFLLFGCTPAEETVLTPTGYPSGEIQRPQIMYNGKVYIYGATGFNEPLPIIYAPVGHVKAIDNINAPTQPCVRGWNASPKALHVRWDATSLLCRPNIRESPLIH